jgi:sugar phosphate isomerase/epimerase
MNPLSINFYVCDGATDLTAFTRIAARVGASAVGLTVRAIDELDIRSIKRLLSEYQLKVSSLNSAGYFLFQESEQRLRQRELNDRLIDAASALGAGTLVVIPGGLGHGMYSPETGRAIVREELAALANRAREAKVTLGIEPIHPVGLLTKGCINTIAQAIELSREYPNVGLTVDFFHSWWDPDFRKVFSTNGELVQLVQICNVITMQHREQFSREVLDCGLMDTQEVLRDIIAMGYKGYVEFEMFPEHLCGRSVENVLEGVGTQYRTMMQAIAKAGRRAENR